MLNIANDLWFKDSDGPTQHLKTACFRALDGALHLVFPTQHLKTACFRAIEEGRRIVRCANNGISAVINCNGELEKILTTDEVGKIESKFPKKNASKQECCNVAVVMMLAVSSCRESTWILNITNDSWFKDSDGPTQHLKTACFRAIEEGRGIVRCANNGISAVINCNGELEKILTTDEVGNIESKFPARYHKTIFSTYKNKTILIVLTMSLLGLLFKRKRIKTRVL